MTVVLYANFSCPYGYLASHRVDALAAVGVEVDWRAVEREPSRPVTGRRLGRAEIEALEQQLSELLLAGEKLPWKLPTFAPNTEAAVSGYAEAYGAGVAAEVRRVLFAAYWVDNADIGSPEVLRRRLAGPILRGHSSSAPLRDFGYAISLSRGPITTGAWRRIRAWREQWAQLNTASQPILLLEGAQPIGGAEAARRLAHEILRLGAPINPGGLPLP